MSNKDRVKIEEREVREVQSEPKTETREQPPEEIRERRVRTETRVRVDDHDPEWDRERAREAEAARERRALIIRLTRGIWLIAGIVEALIGIRFLLKLLAANANAGFARFIYGTTNPLLAPFQGLTATPSAGGSVLEISSLIAMLVYGLLAWIVVRAIWIVADRPA